MADLTLIATFRQYCRDCRSRFATTAGGCLCTHYPGKQYSLYVVEEWTWRLGFDADVWWDHETRSWIGPTVPAEPINAPG